MPAQLPDYGDSVSAAVADYWEVRRSQAVEREIIRPLRPWLGYFMLLEDNDAFTHPVSPRRAVWEPESKARMAAPMPASDRPWLTQDSASRSTIGTTNAPAPHAGSTRGERTPPGSRSSGAGASPHRPESGRSSRGSTEPVSHVSSHARRRTSRCTGGTGNRHQLKHPRDVGVRRLRGTPWARMGSYGTS